MADVTISQLANATPSTGSIIPFSQGGQTYSTALAQLSSLPFIPKAICNFTGIPQGTATIYNSYNIKALTRLGATGIYRVSFDTPLPSANYAVVGQGRNSCNSDGYHLMVIHSGNCFGVTTASPTVNGFDFYTMNFNGSYQDYTFGSFVVFHP